MSVFKITATTIDPRRIGAFLLVIGFTVIVLGYYHDRFWWAPDDAAYAHVAERILAGEVLNGDVQDIHLGYVNFANALALWAFGDQLVSQRYPLVALGLLQSCLIFALFLPRGAVTAVAAAVSLTALSFVQFLNPTAHWYCLFLLVALVCGLSWLPRDARRRLEILGFLVVLMLLFRQLTGVIVAIGTLTLLLCESSGGARGGNRAAARALVTVMAIGLGGYLFAKADLAAWALFGIWPMGILAWAWRRVDIGNRQVARLMFRFGLGGAVAALPLLLYHLVNGSLGAWFDDTVVTALSLTGLDFISRPSYGNILLAAPYFGFAAGTVAGVLNGLFWPLLTLLAALNGWLVLHCLWRRDHAATAPHPLPFLAVFYGVVSAHYQIPGYLFYSAGISLAGVLWMTAGARSWRRGLAPAAALMLAAIGLYYQAAQPLTRGLPGMFRGERVALVPADGLDRAGLWIDAEDARLYRHLIEVIERETGADDSILAIPVNPELYFLSRRKNPFRFFNSALGVRDDTDLNSVLRTLARSPPRLVIHRPDDKYNTVHAATIMDFVKQRYELLETTGGFVIYRSPKDPR